MNKPDETIVEERAGHCWRCGAPFALGKTITMARARFLFRSSRDGQIRRYLEARWGSFCPSCTSQDERDSAPERVICEGCSQPLATPAVDLRVCSDRCAQRWRRRRKRARRPFVACDGCAKRFRPDRHDARFCSNACRQSAYRRRQATGEPIKPRDSVDEGTHLDNIAGVLSYAGIPIIAINRLHPGWPSYGNRYVMAFPHIDEVMPAARDAGLFGYGNHLIECAYCRRWSITRRLVFCSRKCALKARADEARALRSAQPPSPASHKMTSL
jgi:hypothetical protein